MIFRSIVQIVTVFLFSFCTASANEADKESVRGKLVVVISCVNKLPFADIRRKLVEEKNAAQIYLLDRLLYIQVSTGLVANALLGGLLLDKLVGRSVPTSVDRASANNLVKINFESTRSFIPYSNSEIEELMTRMKSAALIKLAQDLHSCSKELINVLGEKDK